MSALARAIFPGLWPLAGSPTLPFGLFGLFQSLTLAQTDPWAAAVLVDELDAGHNLKGRLLLQLSRSAVVRSLVADSTNRRIASARDGRSFWRRRQSSTIRKNSSDTRIWNGRSCGFFEGRPGGRRMFVIIAYFVLTIYTQYPTYAASRR